MKYNFSDRSKKGLNGVHRDLIILMSYAIATSKVDFVVIEGMRTMEYQRKLYSKGRTAAGKKVTWTLDSKHCKGKAVDLYPSPIPKNLDYPLKGYVDKQYYLREHIKKCANKLNIDLMIIKRDLPHYEIL